MRGRTFGGRPTPQPAINPPERSAAAGEHEIRQGDAVFDHDGPSVRQAEESDSPIMHVVREHTACLRDGCDAANKVDHLYTMDGMSDNLKRCVRRAAVLEVTFAGVEDFDNEGVMAEYIADNAELVDYDEVPVLTVQFGDDHYGYWYPTMQDVREEASGKCYGRVDEATRLGI